MLRKRLIPALGLGVMLLAARVSLADTITVHSLSENVTTGVFTYQIQFDAAADVTPNDGFVIYDFPGFESASVSGAILDTADFTMTSQLTSNSLNRSTGVDANGKTAATSNSLPFDNAAIPNLVFAWTGPTTFLGATMAVLTITSDVHGAMTSSVYASVDHSGPTQDIPFSFSANPVEVPTSVPTPNSWLSGLAMIGLVGVSRVKKALCMA